MSVYKPWFTPSEFESRLNRVQALLKEQKLEALLAFEPESITYLTGFFTRGYDSFQFAIIPANGKPLVVCRDMERFYLENTAVFQDHIFWSDGDDLLEIAAQAIKQTVGAKARCGLEMGSWQLTAARYVGLQSKLPYLSLVDCSTLVSKLRILKSAAEIAYQKRAGLVAEAGMTAAIETAVPGNSERDMCAAICSAMIKAGSDRPGPGVLSSGERAFHLHGGYSDRVIEDGDPVQVETTPNVRYYHARFMRPIKAGSATDQEHEFVARLIDIQDRALAEVGPGVSVSVPDQLYRSGVLEAGLAEEYTNKTFYSVGLMFDPTSGEPLEVTRNSSWMFQPNMTLHTYLLIGGFGISETIVITKTGYERLTNFPRKLFVTN